MSHTVLELNRIPYATESLNIDAILAEERQMRASNPPMDDKTETVYLKRILYSKPIQLNDKLYETSEVIVICRMGSTYYRYSILGGLALDGTTIANKPRVFVKTHNGCEIMVTNPDKHPPMREFTQYLVECAIGGTLSVNYTKFDSILD